MTDRDVASSPTGLRATTRRAGGGLAVALSLMTVFGCATTSHAERPGPGCAPSARPVSDDFTGPANTPPNPDMWSYQLGGGGSDGQLQLYTDSVRNASLDGKGNLAIRALREKTTVPGHGEFHYTSARLRTLDRFHLCYGTLSARIKFPAGQGLRPAFWLLGSNVSSVGWPASGEIDVIDVANRTSGSGLHGEGYRLPAVAPIDVTTDWHEYWMKWDRNQIITGIDDVTVARWTPASLPPGSTWIFNDHPMFVILNLGVGGDGGPPDGSTAFPATMLVDRLRYTPLG